MQRQQTLDHFRIKLPSINKIELTLPDAEGMHSHLFLYTDVWTPQEEEEILKQCAKLPYERLEVLGGATNPRIQLRLDADVLGYKYSGTNQTQIDAEPWVHAIVDRILEATKETDRPNMALLNKYTPSDKLGMHRDERKGLVEGKPIFGASFGEQRFFDVLNVVTNQKTRFLLPRRSLCVMGGKMQDYFKHGIPQQKKTSKETRYSFTFRYTQ